MLVISWRKFCPKGLDVFPAVRDYLGLCGIDVYDWKFGEFREVPPGSWAMYGSLCCWYVWIGSLIHLVIALTSRRFQSCNTTVFGTD
jgi:hypothetical protein